MQIHLSDISSSEGKSQHYSVAFEMDTITFQQGTFPVLAKEPVELTITNTGDRVLELEGSGQVSCGEESLAYRPADCFFVPAGKKTVVFHGCGTVLKVQV